MRPVLVTGNDAILKLLDAVADADADAAKRSARIAALEAEREAVRPAVRWFAEQMESALRRNDHKSGWRGDSHDALLARLYEECLELGQACKDQSPTIIAEAADVANFAMMIADNARREALND